jgi:Mn2+/Fe2+ NRAMP family transporter
VVVTNRKIMGNFAASRLLAAFGWVATLFMGAVVAAFFFASVTG